jgi:phytoene/squalene synthetase
MADNAFASFERKWLDANPEQAAVLVFLVAEERRRVAAFGTLIQELAQTAFTIRETQVAAAKLSWWQQELQSACAGHARHPVTIQLFADSRVRAIAREKWNAIVEGALSQLDESSAANFVQLLDRYGRFYNPVAAVESELSGTPAASAGAVSKLWICSHFLSASASGSPLAEHFALPLDLYARHGVARGAAEAGVLRDFIGEVRTTLDAALASASQATVGRRVRARSDWHQASKAMRSTAPAETLARRSARPTLRHVWWSWREARRHRST